MKRYLGILAFLVLMTGCDDGNLQVESFDFSAAQTSSCNTGTTGFFIYKTTENEALIIQLPEDTFENEETVAGQPIKLTISSAVKVLYRLYDANVSASTICSAIPASSPSVTEEWVATGGTIEIVSNAVHPIVESTGASFITGFSHTIIFRNITFDKGDGASQTNTEIPFGTYTTPVQQPALFTNLAMKQCADNNLLFKQTANQVMALDLDDETYAFLFQNTATGTTPRVRYINAGNQLTYTLYESTLSVDAVCNGTTGDSEIQWRAQNGVENVSGIIEVSTISDPETGGYEHTIIFRKINFANSENDLTFTFGNAYEFGKFIIE